MTDDEWLAQWGTRVSVTSGRARVLDGVEVCDPEVPSRTHGVTMDHEITPDGEVYFEVNAEPVELLVT